MLAFGNGDCVPKDNFRGAEIVEDPNKFDATQYSFFGDASTSAALGGLELEGELEDGGIEDELEHGLDGLDVDEQEEEEEDLSLAGLFAARAQVEEAPTPLRQQWQQQQQQQQPFLLDSEVITTPARVRRPGSPSLRLTPGAPASTRQDEPPSSGLAMRGGDLAALEAAQFRQAAAVGSTPGAGPAMTPMSVAQLLQPQFQQSPIPQASAGRLVGPTSAADLEAQMLAQAQPQSPAPTPGQHPGGAHLNQMDHGGGFGMPGMQHHAMQTGMGGLSPYPSPMQQQLDGSLGPQPAGQNMGYGGLGMQQLPGQGMLSPYPGPSPVQQGLGPVQHQQPSPYMQQGPGLMHQQPVPYGHMMQGTPPPPPRPPHQGPLPQRHMGTGMPPSPYHGGPGTPPPAPPPMMGPPYPGLAGSQQQQQYGSPYQQQMAPMHPTGRPAGPPPPPPPQQQHQGPGHAARPPHIQLHQQPQGGRAPGSYQQHGSQGQHGASPMRGPGSADAGGAPRKGGRYMSEDEVDMIMRIMYAAVHTGHSYAEDYYFQAYTNAHCSGRNDATFEPAALRDLSEGVASLDPSASVRFVPLEGLGKIVYSNLRTPRVLLDFGAADKDGAESLAGGSEGGTATVPLRPLEQEPLLAARIMIEDCLNLLLDVDDIDRRFKAAMTRAARAANVQAGSGTAQSPLPADAADLMQRRALLLAGIVSSFQLPHLPAGQPPSDGGAAPALGDRVFRRVMALPKGRKLLARTLLVLSPPLLPGTLGVSAVPNLDPLQLLWATLRSSGWLFGGSLSGLEPAAEKALAEATAQVAASLGRAIGKLREPCELVACLEALGVGLRQGGGGAPGMLPLVRTRRVADEDAAAPREWLGEVVVCLMQRAGELGLATGSTAAGGAAAKENGSGAVPAAERSRWQALVASVTDVLAGHLEVLGSVHAAAAAAGNADALNMVASLAVAAQPVMQAVLAHVTSDQALTRLRGLALAVAP